MKRIIVVLGVCLGAGSIKTETNGITGRRGNSTTERSDFKRNVGACTRDMGIGTAKYMGAIPRISTNPQARYVIIPQTDYFTPQTDCMPQTGCTSRTNTTPRPNIMPRTTDHFILTPYCTFKSVLVSGWAIQQRCFEFHRAICKALAATYVLGPEEAFPSEIGQSYQAFINNLNDFKNTLQDCTLFGRPYSGGAVPAVQLKTVIEALLRLKLSITPAGAELKDFLSERIVLIVVESPKGLAGIDSKKITEAETELAECQRLLYAMPVIDQVPVKTEMAREIQILGFEDDKLELARKKREWAEADVSGLISKTESVRSEGSKADGAESVRSETDGAESVRSEADITDITEITESMNITEITEITDITEATPKEIPVPHFEAATPKTFHQLSKIATTTFHHHFETRLDHFRTNLLSIMKRESPVHHETFNKLSKEVLIGMVAENIPVIGYLNAELNMIGTALIEAANLKDDIEKIISVCNSETELVFFKLDLFLWGFDLRSHFHGGPLAGNPLHIFAKLMKRPNVVKGAFQDIERAFPVLREDKPFQDLCKVFMLNLTEREVKMERMEREAKMERDAKMEREKMTENETKMTENETKMTENETKMTENETKMIENETLLEEYRQKVTQNMKDEYLKRFEGFRSGGTSLVKTLGFLFASLGMPYEKVHRLAFLVYLSRYMSEVVKRVEEKMVAEEKVPAEEKIVAEEKVPVEEKTPAEEKAPAGKLKMD